MDAIAREKGRDTLAAEKNPGFSYCMCMYGFPQDFGEGFSSKLSKINGLMNCFCL